MVLWWVVRRLRMILLINDVRDDVIANEVATDYNAAFTGALARMYDQFGGDPLTDNELDQLIGIDANNRQH